MALRLDQIELSNTGHQLYPVLQASNATRLRVQSTNGYVDIGSGTSSSWGYILTDRANFYVDKSVHFDGNIQGYGGDETASFATYYDRNNTAYYVNPSGTSILSTLTMYTNGATETTQINMPRAGFITFYGDNSQSHSIASRNSAGNTADDLRINTYGALFINLDSNNNNTGGADFMIGRHGGQQGTISDWAFKIDGETKDVGIGTTTNNDGDLSINAPKLHVQGPTTSGAFNLVARFQGGNDNDNTGAAILVNHSNDRGLLLSAGRKDSDREVAYFDLVSSGANITRMFEIGKYGSDYISKFAKPVEVAGNVNVTTSGAVKISGTDAINSSRNFYANHSIYFTYNPGSGGNTYFQTGTDSLAVKSTSGYSPATLFVDDGRVVHNFSTQSPIYYDKDNTSYYLNPADTGVSLKVAGRAEAYQFRGGVTASGDGDDNQPFALADDYSSWAIIFGEAWTNNNGWGIFWAGNDNPAYSYWSTTNPNEAVFVGGGNVRASIDLDNGASYFGNQVRTPIFYDSNNTGYYVDPAASSKMVYLGLATNPNTSGGYRLNMGGSIDMNANNIDYISQLHFNDNVRFFDTGNDNYLAFKWGDANNGGIRFQNGGDTVKGYVYGSDTGFGLLDKDAHWVLQTNGTSFTALRANDNEELIVYTNRVEIPGDIRAPYFYDKDDTAYYLNPAGTSNVNGLTVAGTLTFNGGNVEGYVSYTIDMSNTSTYAENTYYPVTIPLSSSRLYNFRIENALNSNVPGWSTHSSGFSLLLDYTTHGNGWGTHYQSRYIRLWSERYANVTMLGGITQMANSSTEVLWLRGGGKYYLRANKAGLTVTPRSSTFTANSQSVSPTTSIVNDVYSAADGSSFAIESMRMRNYVYHADDSDTYFGFNGADQWKLHVGGGDRLIASTSQLTSNLNFQAPIFYDSNNTNYYVNPAGTSRLGFGIFDGYDGATGNNARLSTGVSIGRYSSEYAYMEIASSNNSGGWIDFNQADGTDYLGRIRYYNNAAYMSLFAATTEQFRVYSYATISTTSSRAPLFFDSNDTTYYLDPAAAGTSLKTAGAGVFGIGGTASWGSAEIDTSTDAGWGSSNEYPYVGSNGGSTGSLIMLHNPHVPYRTDNARSGASGRAGLRCSIDTSATNYWDIGLIGDEFEMYRNASSTQLFRVTNGGNAIASGSFQAPIFYDSDDTGRYVNPAGTSSFGTIHMNNNNLTNVNHITINDPGGGEGIEWLNGNGWKIYESPNDLSNASGNLQFVTTSTRRFTIDTSGNSYSIASSRAPIFYDLDNTNYYVNPNDRSSLLEIFVPPVSSAASGATIRTYAWSDPNWGFSTFASNPNYHVRVHGYGSSHGTDRQFQVVNAASSNAVQLAVNFDGSGTAIGASGTESGYKLTVHGAVHMKNDDINYVRQLHFNDNVRFYDDGNDSYLNFKWGDTGAGGMVFRDGDGAIQGYVYGSGGGEFGLLDNDGNWAVRAQTGTNPLQLRCNDNVEFEVFTTHTHSPGSSRAPIFYDSNNTAYYANPAGYSLLNGITMYTAGATDTGSVHLGRGAWITFYGNSDAHHGIGSRDTNGNLTDDLRINSYHNVHINLDSNNNNGTSDTVFTIGHHGQGAGTVANTAFSVTGGGIATATSDMRAPVFYDSADTSYYVDPANTGTAVYVKGDVVAYGASDERLKDNIKPIDNALDKVCSLSGNTFEWNEVSHRPTGKKDIGVIAQEVEKVFPEIVDTRDSGYKAVYYEKLTAILIEAVKELKEEVKELKDKCNGCTK